MEFLILRTKQLAIDQGSSAILIEENDPELPLLLSWSLRAKEEGFRIAMVSELRHQHNLNLHKDADKKVPAKRAK